jgi:galactose mutarotase-like enzyme
MPSAPTPLETITLTSPTSRALLAPTRGGLLTRFEVGDRSVLYLDEATLLDEARNVRGGNPVLFPSPGPLAGDRFARDGKSGSMKQHGFARNLAWSVRDRKADAVTLGLASDDASRSAYPWDFDLAYRYSLAGATLRIDQRIENRGGDAMPFAAGFHPYFLVPDAAKKAARVPTAATRGWDNVGKRVVPVGPIDLAAKEVDLHLFDHGADEASLELADGARVVVRASPAYRRWVIWTLAGKDFVCLEPWTAPADALNTGEGLLEVPAGGVVDLFVSFALV